jgi:glutamyl-Q tRNA(Asp) synthetase|tara:strand:- start:11397 stop:12260 length:864 start_codon:yes stop_codon:yes gene_type:complete
VDKYRGRFAPSATGPLHLGSVFAALISFLDARYHNGVWLVRIDDLDRFRCSSEHAESILQCLLSFGMEPDEPVIYQSERLNQYAKKFIKLKESGQLYSCLCSRKSLPKSAYPGSCRSRKGQPLISDASVRIDSQALNLCFEDIYQGRIQLEHPGDFIIKRRDGLFSYQLACAIDEHIDGITQVIRGSDLLPSTVMQKFIAAELNQIAPSYGHFPVLTDRSGEKFSKQSFARATDTNQPGLSFYKIAELLLLSDSPKPSAPSTEWIGYFLSLGNPAGLIPRTYSLTAN